MPSIFIPTATFPSVPQLPGVPQLARPIGALAASLPTIIRKFFAPAMPGVLFHAIKAAPVWGVFDAKGNQVISPDSIMDFGFRGEWRVSNYPVQAGQFSSFNKVSVPYETFVRMVKGSTLADRTQFESDCRTVAASMDMFTVITPERSYVGVNGVRLEILRREAKGAFFIDAEMFFQEIKTVTPQYSTTTTAAANTANAQNPAAVPPQNLGLVQPLVVPSAAQTLVKNYLNGTQPSFQSKFFPNPLGP